MLIILDLFTSSVNAVMEALLFTSREVLLRCHTPFSRICPVYFLCLLFLDICSDACKHTSFLILRPHWQSYDSSFYLSTGVCVLCSSVCVLCLQVCVLLAWLITLLLLVITASC